MKLRKRLPQGRQKLRNPPSQAQSKDTQDRNTPIQGFGKRAATKVKGPPTKRKVEEPEPQTDDSDADIDIGSYYNPGSEAADNDNDRSATPSKKKTRPGSFKKTAAKRRFHWCSSESDTETQGPGGISYNNEEPCAMCQKALKDP